MEYHARVDSATSGKMAYCSPQLTRHPHNSHPSTGIVHQYGQYMSSCMPELATLPPSLPPQPPVPPSGEYSQLSDEYYNKSSCNTNELSCSDISSTNQASGLNDCVEFSLGTMLNYPLTSSDDWNLSNSSNDSGASCSRSNSSSNYLSQNTLFNEKSTDCQEWTTSNSNVNCRKENRKNSNPTSFNQINALSNASSNTKKRKMTKSSYKHVPHREKPVHLVARRNARERKRVQAVNLAFVRLRKCVPVENRNKRMSKVKTLQRAIEYIAELGSLLEDDDDSAGESGSIVVDGRNAISATTSSINQLDTQDNFGNRFQMPVSGASYYSATNDNGIGGDQLMTRSGLRYTNGSALMANYNPIEAVHPTNYQQHISDNATISNNHSNKTQLKENYLFKGLTATGLTTTYC